MRDGRAGTSVFPPGPAGVLLPRDDRRCAARGITLYTASRPTALLIQWAGWAWTRVFGAGLLPTGPTPPTGYLAEIAAALGLPSGLPGAAVYRRRDTVRSGAILIAHGSGTFVLVKVRDAPERIGLEQRLLAAVARARPRTFAVPAALGAGTLADGRSWSAQQVVFDAPHGPCTRLPAGFGDDLARVLATAELPGGDQGTVPAHNDLTPWNLRTDRRGRRWLLDWEDAGPAPAGADLGYFHAALGVVRPRRPMPAVPREAADFCAERIRRRLADGHPDGPNRVMLERLEAAAVSSGGR